jgi:hypothetical protein
MCNFGKLNNAFSEVLAESFTKKDKETKKLFQEYLKVLKENKILKTQFLIYKNITNQCGNNDFKIQQFVTESVNLMNQFKTNEIKEANDKLLKILGENSKYLELDYKVKELHENIDKLIRLSNNKNPNNINELVEAFDFVVNYIKTNEPKEETKETFVTEAVAQLAVQKFNEKYSNIDESEYKILKTIIESTEDGKKDIFKSSITECVDLIDEQLKESDIETKDKLLKVKDKLLRMSYNEESFIEDVKKIVELKKDLK